MGMDISGKNPKDAAGEYIRFSIWGWSPMLDLCRCASRDACLDLLTDGWEFNDGHGLDSQTACDKLADAIEALLAKHPEVTKLRSAGTDTAKRFGALFGLDASATLERADVARWVTFLRSCGGFAIH